MAVTHLEMTGIGIYIMPQSQRYISQPSNCVTDYDPECDPRNEVTLKHVNSCTWYFATPNARQYNINFSG